MKIRIFSKIYSPIELARKMALPGILGGVLIFSPSVKITLPPPPGYLKHFYHDRWVSPNYMRFNFSFSPYFRNYWSYVNFLKKYKNCFFWNLGGKRFHKIFYHTRRGWTLTFERGTLVKSHEKLFFGNLKFLFFLILPQLLIVHKISWGRIFAFEIYSKKGQIKLCAIIVRAQL